MPPEPTWYSVPAGTRPSRCQGATCRAAIYWITNPRTGRPLPIHCEVEGGESPSEATDRSQRDLFAAEVRVHPGRGLSHFVDCPDAAQFMRRTG